VRLLGAEHRGLTASVGMASQEDMAHRDLSHRRDRVLQAIAVAGRVTRSRRPIGTGLPIGEVAAHDNQAGGGKLVRNSHKQGSLRVRSRTMRQHECIAIWILRTVQVATYV